MYLPQVTHLQEEERAVLGPPYRKSSPLFLSLPCLLWSLGTDRHSCTYILVHLFLTSLSSPGGYSRNGGICHCCFLIFISLFGCASLSWGMLDFQSSLPMWDLVPWLEIKPRPPALGVWSLSHWTTREVPRVEEFGLFHLLLTSLSA